MERVPRVTVTGLRTSAELQRELRSRHLVSIAERQNKLKRMRGIGTSKKPNSYGVSGGPSTTARTFRTSISLQATEIAKHEY